MNVYGANIIRRGHKRMKQPFPEVTNATTPVKRDSRRKHSNTGSSLVVAPKYNITNMAEPQSLEVHPSTGNASTFFHSECNASIDVVPSPFTDHGRNQQSLQEEQNAHALILAERNNFPAKFLDHGERAQTPVVESGFRRDREEVSAVLLNGEAQDSWLNSNINKDRQRRHSLSYVNARVDGLHGLQKRGGACAASEQSLSNRADPQNGTWSRVTLEQEPFLSSAAQPPQQSLCCDDSANNLRILQDFPRAPSRAPSEAQSRPQSRRSNHGSSMTRPLPQDELRAQGGSDSIILQPTHSASKVKKPSRGQRHGSPVVQYISMANGAPHQVKPGAALLHDFRNFLETATQREGIVKNYEKQLDLQKEEIAKLKISSESSQINIDRLESEKVALNQKVQKFRELSSKYRKHMNEVVLSQKYLKSEAELLKETSRKVSKEALEAENTFYAATDVLQKIETATKDAKTLRITAAKLDSSKLSLVNEAWVLSDCGQFQK